MIHPASAVALALLAALPGGEIVVAGTVERSFLNVADLPVRRGAEVYRVKVNEAALYRAGKKTTLAGLRARFLADEVGRGGDAPLYARVVYREHPAGAPERYIADVVRIDAGPDPYTEAAGGD